MLAYLRKGETYTDLAVGFGICTSTVFRYVREALDVLAARASGLSEAITVAASKALVIIDGTLLRIDRVGMVSGRDRPFYSGKHKRHGVNVQVVAGPAGRLIWASPALPGARHNMGAAREHGLIEALAAAGIRVLADSAYRGAGVNVEVPQRRRKDPETDQRQRLSAKPESRQLRARTAPRTRRTSERPAQELEDPPQDPSLPPPRGPAGQRRASPHPRQLNPSGKRSVTP